MGEMIWIEILSRQLGVIARHRCAGPDIRIGRGYDNDIVLDDPHVAAAHLRIARNSDGVLVAEDLGSANGLYLGVGKERVQRIEINGDQPLRIGNTLLRVREPGYQVVPEQVSRARDIAASTVAAVGVAALLLQLLILWLNETTEPRFASYLPTLLGLPAIALTWSAGWALLCRIFSGHGRFIRNLFIAVAGLLAYTLLATVTALLAFAIAWRPLGNYQFIVAWGAFGAICWLHLREINPSRLGLKATILGFIAAVGIGTQIILQSDARAVQRNYTLALLPPAFRILPAESQDTYFAGIAKIKQKLDQDRIDNPEGE